MIGDVHMKVGGAALDARIEYDSVLLQGIGRLRRRLSRRIDLRTAVAPRFSVEETLEIVAVEFEVPGYGLDELLLEVSPRSLRLRAPERSSRERRRPALGQVVQFPEAVEPDRATATLQDGVLRIELPKLAWINGDSRRVPVRAAPSVTPPQREQAEGDTAA